MSDSQNTTRNHLKSASKSTVPPDQNQSEAKPKRSRSQRIAALLCVVLLVGLYLVTLVVAILDRSASGTWFLLCLIGTIVIPLLTWIYIWMYGMLTQKHTIASFDLGKNMQDVDDKQQ